MLIDEQLTGQIIGAAIEVHRELGPGLLENAYQECLCYELSSLGLSFSKEVPIPVHYKKMKLDCGYRSDIIVEKKVILEIKAIDSILPIHEAQLLTYLKITGLRIGFLFNFHVEVMRNGIKRHVV